MSAPEIDVLTSFVSRIFNVEAITSGKNKDWIVQYRGKFIAEDTAAAYDQLAESVRSYNITPLFRKDEDGKQSIYFMESLPELPPLAKPYVNVILFILAVFSAMLIGVHVPPEIALAADTSTYTYMLSHIFEG